MNTPVEHLEEEFEMKTSEFCPFCHCPTEENSPKKGRRKYTCGSYIVFSDRTYTKACGTK